MGRVIGLDVGTKTVGIAVSDPGRSLASPVRTLSRRSVRDDADRLVALIRDHEADQVVVGLPFELDGTEGRSARLARQIGQALVDRGLVVRYVDERYTSVEADRQLIQAGLSRARRKEVIDQAAAVLILQSWLDHPELEEHG
jgi:putative holliday junction resolvase